MIDREKINTIEKYAQLINDELGEYWTSLVNLYSSRDFLGSKFEKAYEKEIDRIYKYIKENAKIKVTEHTYTQKVRDVVFMDSYEPEPDDKFEDKFEDE